MPAIVVHDPNSVTLLLVDLLARVGALEALGLSGVIANFETRLEALEAGGGGGSTFTWVDSPCTVTQGGGAQPVISGTGARYVVLDKLVVVSGFVVMNTGTVGNAFGQVVITPTGAPDANGVISGERFVGAGRGSFGLSAHDFLVSLFGQGAPPGFNLKLTGLDGASAIVPFDTFQFFALYEAA